MPHWVPRRWCSMQPRWSRLPPAQLSLRCRGFLLVSGGVAPGAVPILIRRELPPMCRPCRRRIGRTRPQSAGPLDRPRRGPGAPWGAAAFVCLLAAPNADAVDDAIAVAPPRGFVFPAAVFARWLRGAGAGACRGGGGVGEAPHRWGVLPAIVGLELTEGVGHAVEVGVSPLAVLRRWQREWWRRGEGAGACRGRDGVGEAPHRWSVLPAIVGLDLTKRIGPTFKVNVTPPAVLGWRPWWLRRRRRRQWRRGGR